MTRVRRNEWGSLEVPQLGAATAPPSVSVIVPAWRAGRLLPTVLAALAAQSHPAHLLEVVVVDDGPDPPLTLPQVRPEHTRLLRVVDVDPTGGWGRANACHLGAMAAEGEVLHWLDADMLAERHEVEAQARWHGVLDHAVVLGQRTFVDPAPVLALRPAEVRDAVAGDRVGDLFPVEGRRAHTWVEELYGRTDDLRQAGWYAVRAHVGMTGSVRRELYLDAGGLDRTLRLGEDTALGVRLGEAGAVFVPDREAVAWHLGLSNVMRRHEQVNAYNAPHLAEHYPVLRSKRVPGRTYAVPYLEVVLDVRAVTPGSDVIDVVDAVLAGTLHDVAVTLLGDWDTLTDARVDVLDDASSGLRLVHDSYRHEPRVCLRTALPAGRPDAPFRLTLPGVAFAPGRRALERLLLQLEHTHDGRRRVALPDGTAARLERTAAYARAARVAGGDENLDDVVDELAGGATVAGDDVGFRPAGRVRPGAYPRTGGPPLGQAEAWARVDRALAARAANPKRPGTK